MIPEIPREFDPASHEGTAFQALSRLPDDYYVFHSLSLVTINQRNFFKEREIDFLVVNQQKGILCIEVKAGSGIHYENGQWYYTNGTLMPHNGPYKQAESAKYYLMSAFDEQQDNNIRALKSKCKFLHAVWFLDMHSAPATNHRDFFIILLVHCIHLKSFSAGAGTLQKCFSESESSGQSYR